MRVSSVSQTRNYNLQLQKTYSEYSKLFEQSDGNRLHRASDDAPSYAKYLRFQNSLTENEQYQTNTNTALSWMNNSDKILESVGDNLQTFTEKVVAASNGTNTETDMQDIGKELLSIVQEIVLELNGQVGDRFLFSGQSDTTMPFSISSEMLDRGVTKTLDDTAKQYFTNASGTGSVYQFLSLEGSDGNQYYMNTKDGQIYTKEFVDSGYKTNLAMGITTVQDTDAIGSYTQSPTDITVEGTSVNVTNTGNKKTLTDKQQTFFENTELEEWSGDDGKTYYRDARTGNIYDEDTVNNAGTTTQRKWQDSDVVDNFHALTVGDYFASNGVINQDGQDFQTDITVDGQNVTLTFSTISQYVASYNGDDKYISMVTQNGMTKPDSDTVNVTGQDIFGSDLFDCYEDHQSGTAMLNELLTVVAKTNSCDYDWNSTDGITVANTALSVSLGAQTTMAARNQAYQATQSILVTANETIESDISSVASTDVAQLSTQLMQQQTIYSLSLSVGSKILPGTLADYLS